MVREDLNSKVCTDLNCVDTGNTDHLWCKISTKDSINMIVIGLIYRPPNNNYEDDSNLNSLLIAAEQQTIKKQLLVWGDLNYPDIRWDIGGAQSGTKQEEFMKTINDLCWLQNVNDVTRVRVNNKPSMLDLVFTRRSKEIDYLKFNPCLGKSDHVVLVFSICVEELLRHKKMPPRRDYSRANYDEVRAKFNEINWGVEFSDKDVNKCYEIVLIFHENYSRMCTKNHWSN